MRAAFATAILLTFVVVLLEINSLDADNEVKGPKVTDQVITL